MTLIPETPSRLRVQPMSRLTGGPRWQVEAMRALREPVLLWFSMGQGRITIAGRTRGFHANNAIFLPPDTMHGFAVTHRANGAAVFFGRDCALDLPSVPHHFRLREKSDQSELAAIIDNIQREVASTRTGGMVAARHHLGLLGVWIARQLDEREDAHTGEGLLRASERLAARYAALLEREFRSGLCVADYARALGVTPTHLTRACKASCARTAHDLLQDRRLFEARRLLLDTRMPVQDVARALGYSTPGYFTRNFQLHAGQTPSAFRRNGGAAPGDAVRMRAV
ncbi:helix-turn-helix transcriptional regulator [Rhabdonatronobacter sediminivivens]|nr:AraC family transcriptional regulator [Rhabdonatronobacter sediminivivens]